MSQQSKAYSELDFMTFKRIITRMNTNRLCRFAAAYCGYSYEGMLAYNTREEVKQAVFRKWEKINPKYGPQNKPRSFDDFVTDYCTKQIAFANLHNDSVANDFWSYQVLANRSNKQHTKDIKQLFEGIGKAKNDAVIVEQLSMVARGQSVGKGRKPKFSYEQQARIVKLFKAKLLINEILEIENFPFPVSYQDINNILIRHSVK